MSRRKAQRYEFVGDGIYSRVALTDDEDGVTFREAKAELVEYLSSEARYYREAAQRARKLRKADVEEDDE